MTATPALIVAVLVLGAGTYALRLAGPALRSRGLVPDRLETALSVAAVVLLVAAAATAALLRLLGVS